jgi:hypothetical protein
MKNTHIASLSLKLLGIYSIIEAIPLLKVFTDYFLMQKTMTRFTGSEQASNATLIDVYIFIAGLVPFLILICLGVYLIKNSDIISDKLVIDNNESTIEPVSVKNIQAIAFSIVGIVLIVIATPKLLQTGVSIYAKMNTNRAMMLRDVAPSIIVQVIVGSYLFYGSKGLSRLWESFQNSRVIDNEKDT